MFCPRRWRGVAGNGFGREAAQPRRRRGCIMTAESGGILIKKPIGTIPLHHAG
jgi:hypothetical protein